ncbi:MAG: cysteine synthase A [Polyangiaceae bacterium]|nr:cysteine synthase A [Polyangiaceae bacterium]
MSSELPPIATHPSVYGHLLDMIGDTPLVEIKIGDGKGATVWGKLEAVNPGGSVKDRICLAMIEKAESDGSLQPGGVVIEPTSGNTGIGLAIVCGRRGYRCILTMPESMSLERRALLEALGAELVLTPAEDQMDGAISRAEELAKQTPKSFVPHQFENPENPDVHYRGTGPEILHALGERKLCAFVAGVGTGGTISGAGRALKEKDPETRVIAVEPDSCATISRGERGPTKIQGLAAGFVPKNYHPGVVDEVRTVSDNDAYQTKLALAHDMGLLVGISAGAAVHAALEYARTRSADEHVVTVLPDTGERYFSLDSHFKD